MSESPTVWYFAYGSNLDPETFTGWRQMRPSDARPARLREYALVFDLPVGGERGVANILPQADAETHGVAYRIEEDQAKHLDASEGVPKLYERLPIELTTPEGALHAFTYISNLRSDDRKPSERYMNLLLRGARHHRLPHPWLEYLRSLELAVDERLSQLELFGGLRTSGRFVEQRRTFR